MLIKLLPMVLVVCIGYGLKRGRVLGPPEAKTIGKLLTHLALPAVIVKALAIATITPDLFYLPVAALLVVLSLTLISGLALRLLQWERATAGALMTTFPSFEGGAVGYPVMLLAFGEAGLSRLVLFDLAQALYLLTVVYSLAAWFGQAQVSARGIAVKLARTPFFWAILVGFGLNGLGLAHGVLLELLTLIGGSFPLLVLLLLGMEFQVQPTALGGYLLLALAKVGGGLGLGWLFATALGLEGLERAAVLVGAALPPSLLAVLFTQENHLDTRFAVSFISVAVPLYGLVIVLLLNRLGP